MHKYVRPYDVVFSLLNMLSYPLNYKSNAGVQYMAIALGHDGRAYCLDIGSATCSPVLRVRAKLVFLLFNVYILSTCFVHIGYYCDTVFFFFLMHIFLSSTC